MLKKGLSVSISIDVRTVAKWLNKMLRFAKKKICGNRRKK
jgi:hypothetical protein